MDFPIFTVSSNIEKKGEEGMSSLINSKVRKIFDDEIYVGKVQKYDSDTKWYKIVYEDGDEEEMTEDEVRHYLIKREENIG